MSTTDLDDDAALEAAMMAEDIESGRPADETAEADEEPAPQADGDTPVAVEATEGEPAAEAPPEAPAKPAGVMGKDGKTILPYGALAGARHEAKQNRQRAERAEAELADLKAGKKPGEAEGDGLTDEYLQEVAADFPQLAPLVKAVQHSAKAAPKAEPEEVDDGSDPLQEAIDSVPLLAGWQADDPQKWARARKIDSALEDSPKWAGKPLAERFAHVARQVAAEFDIQTDEVPAATPATPAKQRQDPAKVIESAKRSAPNTLSDFKGGSPDATRDDIDRMPAQSQLNRAMDMSDEALDAWLRKVG